jgi:acetyl-CoA C-acetyltransferase
VAHWDGNDATTAPDPASLRYHAARAALADSGTAGALAAAIDQVLVIRTMSDSVPGAPQPFGRCANPPGTLATDLGFGQVKAIYSVVGGDQPQAVVNQAAEAIFAGEARAVLIAGSEATAALKTALRKGVMLDWSRSTDAAFEDRGLGKRLLSPYDIANGLGAPTQTYPAFEHALRARMGLDRQAYAALMAELWAGFSKVAAANPFSQFPVQRSIDFLMTPSSENYPVADPYLKWHVAQDAVNQGAAVVLTSVAQADRLGIAQARRVYLHGYAEAADRTPSERPDLSRSRAIELVLAKALAAADKTASAITQFDLYSCFPCAVLLAAEALGLDWRTTPATVTGGLPFFGGPGNSYSLHAIATMVDRLRAAPADFGLVLANGGFLSKEAAGVYSATPKLGWQPVSSAALAQQIAADPVPKLADGPADATIESYTVTFTKGIPARGYVIATIADGSRILARARRDDAATLGALLAADPVGRRVSIGREGEINIIDAIGQAA